VFKFCFGAGECTLKVYTKKPIILATQEAQIRRITVQGQSTQIVHETLSLKYPTQKSAGGVAQVVECLLCKHIVLSSNSSITKKKS
jgi:hypothetical protein